MLNVHAELLEGTFVEERFDSVARGHQTLCAARFKLFLAACIEHLFAALLQLVHQFF